jgi:hypothetical protein
MIICDPVNWGGHHVLAGTAAEEEEGWWWKRVVVVDDVKTDGTHGEVKIARHFCAARTPLPQS